MAVFLPTRAEVERLGAELETGYPRLASAFYHGGEPIRVLRPFLEGEVAKPYLLAMTAAGQSALNLPGLDTVIIYDARYGTVVDHGRNVLHRMYLGANEILQMAGRVHGRVRGGEVVILSDRDLDFASLRPGPPEFQLAGDAERVALTCAELGVDAGDLELPVPLDRRAYRRAVDRLTQRGLIEAGRLTRYGRQVEALPVERPWAELLLHANADQLPLVAGASGIDSLHRMTREERDLHGVLVSGSDHLTAYNLLAEAIETCGRIGEVHGLQRHLFDEEELTAWADRRGVLIKAIEDGALGLAAAYRSLDVVLPERLPRVTPRLRDSFIDLVARIEPFDLALDEQTADGQAVRIAKTSVAGSWGAIAGTLRYFADRFGVARASIDGTTLPYELLRKYAVQGPAQMLLTRHKHRQELAIQRPQVYFGFELHQASEPLRGEFPAESQEPARATLARALFAGEVEHPDRARLKRSLEALDEYWRRSGGALGGIGEHTLRELIRAQLGDVTSWEAFQRTPVRLDVAALVDPAARRHLDALPASVHLRGDTVPLVYEVRDGQPMVRVYLREGQATRLRPSDLPALDRPLIFAVRRRGDVLQADRLDALQELLRQAENHRPAAPKPPPRSRGKGPKRGWRGRGPRGRPRR